MSAPVCESKWQCQMNGLSGTAAIMSVFVLIWGVIDGVPGDIWLLLPTLLAAGIVGAVRLRGRNMGWAGFAIAVAGCAWGIFVLNGGMA